MKLHKTLSITGFAALVASILLAVSGVGCTNKKETVKDVKGDTLGQAPIQIQPASGNQGPIVTNTGTVERKTDPNAAKPFTTEEALDYLKVQCAGCHGPQKDFASFWAMPKDDEITFNWLENNASLASIYQSIAYKVQGKENTVPSPMPRKTLSDEEKVGLQRLQSWFNHVLPIAVQAAAETYGEDVDVSNITQVNMSFECSATVTGRKLIGRITNSAFNREPKPDEFKLLTDAELSAPVTEQIRTKLAAKLDTEGDPWKEEFKKAGLWQFANKLASTSQIKPNGNFLSQAQANDLKQEFYQLLLKNYDTLSYKDILLLDRVMVSANTAALYGNECQAPAAGQWNECKLPTERSNFFGTVGFLRSRPVTFLEPNNNYGRHAEMYLIINGEALVANTNGVRGDTIDPLPSCLVGDEDYRAEIVASKPDEVAAPKGTLMVPASGNVCQKCHVQRHLAVGSILFRPFGLDGEIINPASLVNNDPRYGTLVRDAVDPNKYRNFKPGETTSTRISPDFLRVLLNWRTKANFKPCAQTAASKTDVEVLTLKDLTGVLIGSEGQHLYKGLSRHFPRVYSNFASTNQDIMRAIDAGVKAGQGKLGPIVKEYFATKTFACEVSKE